MKAYEKNLKSLLQEDSITITSYETNLTYNEIIFLKAKGLIEATPYSFDAGFKIQITDKGITYFDDKRQATIASIRNWSMNIGIALLSACAGALLSRISLILWP